MFRNYLIVTRKSRRLDYVLSQNFSNRGINHSRVIKFNPPFQFLISNWNFQFAFWILHSEFAMQHSKLGNSQLEKWKF